jgi:hypothetical protein
MFLVIDFVRACITGLESSVEQRRSSTWTPGSMFGQRQGSSVGAALVWNVLAKSCHALPFDFVDCCARAG